MTSTRNSACPSCGTPTLPEGARFCPSCGTLLAGAIPKGALSPEDELHPVTVMFPDVVGSIALGARLPPEEVKALVGECVSAMARAVEDHGGFVQAYQGDGICAVFGIPAAHEDDPERAARAALRILEVVGAYAHDVQATWGISSFNVRIGIDTGPAVVGTLGASDPQVSALGDATNTAARLQGAAEPGEIVMGQSTAARLSDRFVLREVGPFALKGKAEPVRAFRVVGERRESSPRSLLPLVGRDQERKELSRVLADLASGRGQVVSIIGEAGIGKSRLLAELHAMTGPDLTWLEGRCLSYGGELTYWPFIEILRGWLEVTEGEAEVAVRLRLKAKLTSLLGPRTPEVLPYLGRLLSVKLDPEVEERVRYLPPEALAEQIHQAYRMWVEALAAPHPLILAIEDLHWADPSTRALAEALVAATEHAPLLLACAYRAEPDSEAWKFRLRVMEGFSHRAQDLPLEPLAGPDMARLADTTLAGAELDASSRQTLVARAEGNPLYLEQLLLTLIEAGEVAERRVVSVDERALASFPPALEGLLVARIDRLPPGPRRLAQVAAVAGRSFLRRVLERVASGSEFESDLRTLLRTDLIREHSREPELEYVFTHGLIQEAAASTLTRIRRRALHGQVARAFEDLFAGGIEDYLEILAHHFAESEERPKAREYLDRAGDKAAGLYANQQAMSLWERAAEVARALEDDVAYRRISEKLADLLSVVGEHERAVAMYRSLAKSDAGDSHRLIARAAWTLLKAGAHEEASSLVESVQGELDPVTAIRLRQARALAAYRADRVIEMKRHLDEAEGLFMQDTPSDVALERAFLWMAYFEELGDYTVANSWADVLLQLSQGQDDPVRLLEAKKRIGVLKLEAGELVRAEILLREAYEQARHIGFVVHTWGAGVNLLYAYLELGQIYRGLALCREFLELHMTPFWRSVALQHVALLEMESGQTDGARAHLQESLRVSSWLDDPRGLLESRIHLCAVDVLDGNVGPETERMLAESVDAAGALEGRFGLRALAQYWLAELLLRRGDAQSAEMRSMSAVEAATSSWRALLPRAFRALGLSRHCLSAAAGKDELQESLSVARSLGMRLDEGRALAALAWTGLAPNGHDGLEQARFIFTECGAARDLAQLEAPPYPFLAERLIPGP